MDVFRKLNEEKGLTICIVTHDRNLAKKVNRVLRICDGKVSSEDIRIDYAKELSQVGDLSEQALSHDTYAVLDRAGRVQLSKENLSAIGVTDHKVKITVKDGQIIISA